MHHVITGVITALFNRLYLWCGCIQITSLIALKYSLKIPALEFTTENNTVHVYID